MTIGIYARKSVYRDNSDSVQVQIKACRDYANIVFHEKELEFKIYDRDEGFSGKNTNRPSFQELISDVTAGKLDAVMVYKLDRISRSVKDFSDTYETLQKNNVAFLSVKETFDTSTPIGRTVMYILAAFAQLERENTSERVSDSMTALGAGGKWTGGKLPAGMKSVRKMVGEKEHSFLLVNEDKIEIVEEIYRLYLSGKSITGIERYFRDNGIRTEQNKFFGANQIHSILANPVYCSNDPEAYAYFKDKGYLLPAKEQFDGTKGLIGYGKTRQGNTRVKNENWSVAIGIHRPVIPAADWIRCQKRFGENKMYRGNKYESGILKGILRCQCGSRVDIRTYSKHNRLFSYYYCAKMARQGKTVCNTEYVRVNIIDNLFIQKLQEIKLSPESIVLKTDTEYINTDKLKADVKKAETAIANLTKVLMDNMTSSASGYIIAQIETLDREKSLLAQKLEAAERNNRNVFSAVDTKAYIHKNICHLLNHFDDMSYTEKNELLRNTVTSCILTEKGIRIVF